MTSRLLTLATWGYEHLARPLIFRQPAQTAHERVLTWLRWADRSALACNLLAALHRQTFARHPVQVGAVDLPHPCILAAGLVKGDGFDSEDTALAAVTLGRNIIPGWRAMPALVGPVEFGSFTRWPRLGNAGTLMWRQAETRSTQNRVGLRNPGVRAAAAFLARHRSALPSCFGVNIAASPGLDDTPREAQEIAESLVFFLGQGIRPSWFTLNLSCPNTEDDPGSKQTESHTRALLQAAQEVIRAHAPAIPLWVKVSPALAPNQYDALVRVLAAQGVAALIATNTLARPTPDDPQRIAGVGGGALHGSALEALRCLQAAREQHSAPFDLIGCGGIMDGETCRAFQAAGARAFQYWSALVYRGPLAGALIESEGHP